VDRKWKEVMQDRICFGIINGIKPPGSSTKGKGKVVPVLN